MSSSSNSRLPRFYVHADGQDTQPDRMMPYISVLDMLCHIPRLASILMAADPLDIIGSENERIAFLELKAVISAMHTNSSNNSTSDGINLQPLINKIRWCSYTNIRRSDTLDVLTAWDEIIKLIMVVIPPFRDVFLGQVESAQEVPDWLNMKSYCFRAHYTTHQNSLDSIFRNIVKNTLTSENQRDFDGISLRLSNALVIKRAPEIFVVQIESTLLPTYSGTVTSSPESVMFPYSFDLETIFNSNATSISDISNSDSNRLYELIAVSSLEGDDLSELHSYFRVGSRYPCPAAAIASSSSPIDIEADLSNPEQWYRGELDSLEVVSRERVVEGNYYRIADQGGQRKNVHPRLLVYARNSLAQTLERTSHSVSKGGLMRALGDAAFTLALTPESYSEARRCYEEAIALDESLRESLQDKLRCLDNLEKKHRAHALEEQADLALANSRFREACELYNKALKFVLIGSDWYKAIYEKFNSVNKIILLDATCAYAERGEEAMRNNQFTSAKEHFQAALKLHPEILHLHNISSGVDKTVHLQIVRQKTLDANAAIKAFKYRMAQQLLLEAVGLVPAEKALLQPILDDLEPLIKSENALGRQRAGNAAAEEKRFSVAIALFTEAMTLLPEGSNYDHAAILCDRAHAYLEIKDLPKALEDCNLALEYKNDYAMAYFRLGAVQFGMEMYSEALIAYEKALKLDPALAEQVKVKIRQVSSAKEVQERKERELERAKAKEEEKKQLEEKRLRDEQLKKEKAERLAVEQAEKAEKQRQKEEERKAKIAREKELQAEREAEKEAEKERLRLEKLERDVQKQREREKVKAEKEKEKENQRKLKEKRAEELVKKQEAERLAQQKLAEERAAQEAKQKEIEDKKKEAALSVLEKMNVSSQQHQLQSKEKKKDKEKKKEEQQNAAAAAAAAASSVNAVGATISSVASSVSGPVAGTASSSVSVASDSSSTDASALASGATDLSRVISPSPTQSVSTKASPSPSVADLSTPPPKLATPGKAAVPTAAAAMPYAAVAFQPPQAPVADSRLLRQSAAPNQLTSMELRSQDFPPLGASDNGPASAATASSAAGSGKPVASWASAAALPSNNNSNSNSAIATNSSGASLTPSGPVPVLSPASASLNSSSSNLAGLGNAATAAANSVQPMSLNSMANNIAIPAYRQQDADELKGIAATAFEYRPSPEVMAEAIRQQAKMKEQQYMQPPGSLIGGQQQMINSGTGSMRATSNPVSSTSPLTSGLGLDPTMGLKFSSLPAAKSNVDSIYDSISMFDLSNLGLSSNASNAAPALSSTDSLMVDSLPLLNDSLFGDSSLPLPASQVPLLDGLFGGKSSNVSRATSFGFNIVDTLDGSDSSSSLNKLASLPPPPSSQQGYGSNSTFSNDLFKQSSGFDSSIDEQIRHLTAQMPGTLSFARGPSPLPAAASSSSSAAPGMLGSSIGSGSLLGVGSLGFGTDLFGVGSNNVGGDSLLRMPSDPYGFSQSQAPLGNYAQTSQFPPGVGGVGGNVGSLGLGLNRRPSPGPLGVPSEGYSFGSLSSLSMFNAPAPGLSLNSIGMGIAADVHRNRGGYSIADNMVPESMFASVAWLRQYNMHIYRWEHDDNDMSGSGTVERYGMHIPRDYLPYLFDADGNQLREMVMRTQCTMWLTEEFLAGQKETFLIMSRDVTVSMSGVDSMMTALDMISYLMRQLINSKPAQQPSIIGGGLNSLLGVSANSSQNSQSFAKVASSAPLGSNIGIAQTSSSKLPISPSWSGNDMPSLVMGSDMAAGLDQSKKVSLTNSGLPLSAGTAQPLNAASNSALGPAQIATPRVKKPDLLVLPPTTSPTYIHRALEIPRETVGMIIGHGGKKIKDLSAASGAKIQFKVNKSAERDGRPGYLDVQGTPDNVESAMQAIWDLLQAVGKVYNEIPAPNQRK